MLTDSVVLVSRGTGVTPVWPRDVEARLVAKAPGSLSNYAQYGTAQVGRWPAERIREQESGRSEDEVEGWSKAPHATFAGVFARRRNDGTECMPGLYVGEQLEELKTFGAPPKRHTLTNALVHSLNSFVLRVLVSGLVST